MNLALLVELDDRLRRIEAIADGQASGDIDALVGEMLERAAAVAGPTSPEYGLAVRARASVYRNRGELARAADEYARASELLMDSGDEVLFQSIQAITSLTELYVQLEAYDRAAETARQAVERIARYANDPGRHAPPVRPDEDDEGAGDEVQTPVSDPAGDVVSQLASAVAQAIGGFSPDEGIRVFDSLVAATTAKPLTQLALLLARAAFAARRGSEAAARESFHQAWSLAHEPGREPDGIPLERWAVLARWALRFGQGEDARQIAHRLAETPPAADNAAYLSSRLEGLRLEAEIDGKGDDLEAAERALRRLQEFCTSTFGPDAEPTIDAEGRLGRFLVNTGRPGEALPLLRHVAGVRVNSPSHPDERSAGALFDLGYGLDRSGDDTRAIGYYASAYRLYASLMGPDHPKTVSSALGAAETSRVARDHEAAERWFRRALESERRGRKERTERLAFTLHNLAQTLLAAGRADEAAPLADQGLALRKELFGTGSSEYQLSLAVVMQIALQRGDDERIDAILESLAADGIRSVPWPVDLIAALHEYQGEDDQAVRDYEETLERFAAGGVEDDGSLMPGQDISLEFRLGELLARLGRWADARRHLLHAFEAETILISDESGRRSRRQMQQLLKESRQRVAILLNVLARDSETPREELTAAYEVIQRRKSVETRLLRLQKPSYVTNPALFVIQPGVPDRPRQIAEEMDRLAESLRRAREDWASALIRHARGEGPGSEDASVLALQDRVEFFEIGLASYVGWKSLDWELLGFTSSVPGLAEAEAVLEYVFVTEPTPAYYAFVVQHDQAIHFRPLGDAGTIHQALTQLRNQIINVKPRPDDPDPPWRRRARFLANRLIRPLLDLLGGVDRLYVVPDGELFTLPFDLLPLDDEHMAIDRWIVTHLWHGGERGGFRAFTGAPTPGKKPVVVSAPALGGITSDGTTVEDCNPPWQFAALPFAEREGEAVADKLGADHLHGPAATKDALLERDHAEILHIATHSFYIPRAPDAASEIPQVGPDALLFRARSALAEPMERSGIALTGADRELNDPTPTSPGILFASEVLDMDLRGTDITVLSSCQSGLGDPHPGDGIQGLRRAFRAAGAQSVVSSLWKVPDEAAHELMVGFYDRLLGQAPRGEALRDAKKDLRAKYRNDPLFWAGFVLDGFDGPLSRFSPLHGLTFGNISGIGLTHASAMELMEAEQWDEAIAKFVLVIESETADPDMRAEAAYERAGILRRTGRYDEALEAYHILINRLDTPAERRRAAVADRGMTRQFLGDLEGAYQDYTSVLNAPEIPDDFRIKLLVNRGFTLSLLEEWDMAIADFTAVIEGPESPANQVLMALLNRADVYRQIGDYPQAIAEATRLTEWDESSGTSERAKGHLILALCHLEQGRFAAAVESIRRHLSERMSPPPPGVDQALASLTAAPDAADAPGARSRLFQLLVALSQ